MQFSSETQTGTISFKGLGGGGGGVQISHGKIPLSSIYYIT